MTQRLQLQMTLEELNAVRVALEYGREIQVLEKDGVWRDFDYKHETVDVHFHKYRVKPLNNDTI